MIIPIFMWDIFFEIPNRVGRNEIVILNYCLKNWNQNEHVQHRIEPNEIICRTSEQYILFVENVSNYWNEGLTLKNK